jgi:hypothetical protein
MAHSSHGSALRALEGHQQPRPGVGVGACGLLQRRDVAPGTPRSSGSMSMMKCCSQLPLFV